jgi:hypothetical protein
MNLNLSPKALFVLEQTGVALSKWFLRVCLPTLGATMVGALVYLLLILGLGLSLSGCSHGAHSNESVTTVPTSPPPPTDPQCITLVHATCVHYAECHDESIRPAAALYAECWRHMTENVFDGQLCVDPGAKLVGPVNLCAAELLSCGEVAAIELVCGAVQVVRAAPEK